MTCTEMLINGFKAILAEQEARNMPCFNNSVDSDPMTDQDIRDRLYKLGDNIHDKTGFIYERREIEQLYKSYAGVNV